RHRDPLRLPPGPGGAPVTATPPGGQPAAAPGRRGPDLRGPRVGVVAEQLLRPVPGGVGRYVRALATHLPVEAAVDRGAVEFLVARHPAERLEAAGLPPTQTRRLRWPGRLVTRTWVTMRRPGLPAGPLHGPRLVPATSPPPVRRAAPPAAPAWVPPPPPPVPPTRGRPLVATVHDLAFRHYPEAYPAAGRRYHERSARIVADEGAPGRVPPGAAPPAPAR